MLPFSLKIVWLTLCLTGTAVGWIVMYAFMKVKGCYWVPIIYALGVTLLQGAVSLGMIWRMDPLLMPRAWCIAQIFLISFFALAVTGFCSCFSFATSVIFFWPEQMDTSPNSVLRWRSVYLIPIFVIPAVAATGQVTAFVKLDAVRANDNLHCEIGNPLWIRFLGYAGVSWLLSMPSFILTIFAGIRMFRNHKAHRHLSRELCNFTASSFGLSLVHSNSSAPHGAPFKSCGKSDGGLLSISGCVYPDSPASLLRGSTISIDLDPLAKSPDLALPKSEHKVDENTSGDMSSIVFGRSPSTMLELEPRFVQTIDNVNQTQTLDISHHPSELYKPKGFLSGIWRLVLFQIGFFIVEILVILSTLICIIRKRPPPAFGTEHAALLLAAWGPSAMFIHSPGIWKEMCSWLHAFRCRLSNTL